METNDKPEFREPAFTARTKYEDRKRPIPLWNAAGYSREIMSLLRRLQASGKAEMRHHFWKKKACR